MVHPDTHGRYVVSNVSLSVCFLLTGLRKRCSTKLNQTLCKTVARVNVELCFYYSDGTHCSFSSWDKTHNFLCATRECRWLKFIHHNISCSVHSLSSSHMFIKMVLTYSTETLSWSRGLSSSHYYPFNQETANILPYSTDTVSLMSVRQLTVAWYLVI